MPDSRYFRILVRGGAMVSAGSVGTRLLHVLTYAILARMLDAEAFGAIGLASVVVGALALFQTLGIGTALLAGREDPRPLARSALTVSLLSGLALVLISLAMFPMVSAVYGELVAGLIAIIGLSFGFRASCSVQGALLDRELRFSTRAVSEFTGGVAFFTCAIGLASMGAGAFSIAWGLVAAAIATTVVQTAATRLKPTWRPQWRKLRGTCKTGAVILTTTILSWAFVSGDVLIVESRYGLELVGAYTMAVFLAMQPANVLGFLAGRLGLPSLVRARDSGHDAAPALLCTASFAGWVSAGASVLFVLAAPPLIGLAFGSGFEMSAVVLPILAFYSYGRVFASFGGSALLATDRSKTLLAIALCQVAVALPVAWLLPESAGAVGVAAVFSATALVACLGSYWRGAVSLGAPGRAAAFSCLFPITASLLPGAVLAACGAPVLGAAVGLAVAALGACHAGSRIHDLVTGRPPSESAHGAGPLLRRPVFSSLFLRKGTSP